MGRGTGKTLFLEAVFRQELIDSPGAVQHLLLAGVKRVTVAADFRGQLFAAGGAGLEDMAAGAAGNGRLVVVGMDTGFHGWFSFAAVGTPIGGPLKRAGLNCMAWKPCNFAVYSINTAPRKSVPQAISAQLWLSG